MHRKHLLDLLKSYRRDQSKVFSIKQDETLSLFEEFILLHDTCFERSNQLGHVTGSAFIFSNDLEKVLLMRHKKLKKWLQMGGHADGMHFVHEIALKEALEETGLTNLIFADYSQMIEDFQNPLFPLDFDICIIPPWKEVPAHLHLDVRFFLISEGEETLTNSDEAHDLRWVPIREVTKFTHESSVLRPIQKVHLLKKQYLTCVAG